MHQQPLRGFSEPFCHSDKAITLKGAGSPGMLSLVSPLISSVSLFSHSLFFFPSPPTCFLSLLYHYRPISHSILLYASLFTNELGYTCMRRAFMHVTRGNREGGGASKLHTYRAQMLHVQREGPRTPMIRAGATHTHACNTHVT